MLSEGGALLGDHFFHTVLILIVMEHALGADADEAKSEESGVS